MRPLKVTEILINRTETMDRIERVYKIDHLLKSRSVVSFREFLEALEVSDATLKRDLEYMRDRLNAPINWDRDAKGYRLTDISTGPKYELPGLWFSSTEAHAVLTMQHLIENLEPGLLGEKIRPLQARLQAILGYRDHSVTEVRRRIRILHMTSRRTHLKNFEIVATGVLTRKRIHIKYLVRERNELTTRDVSPQRLVHYRENWYLDGWCHLRNDVRRFAVDAIEKAVILNAKAKHVSEKELDVVLEGSYGIFSGKATKMAKLKFSAQRARWVSLEAWHPKQRGSFTKAGAYVLQVPYNDDRELVGDILKHGPDVEVLSPLTLRDRVAEQLRATAKIYV
ncbi:MAG: WYL domain-containing protein [Betaproteobacteria bacterium]